MENIQVAPRELLSQGPPTAIMDPLFETLTEYPEDLGKKNSRAFGRGKFNIFVSIHGLIILNTGGKKDA